jgi:hypothetical protein
MSREHVINHIKYSIATGLSLVKGKNVIRSEDLVHLAISHQTSKPAQIKTIRITKSNGDQIGKLSSKCTLFASTLMDMDIIYIKATVILVPSILCIGSEIILSLSISLKPSAFKKLKGNMSDDCLNKRKQALLFLFDQTGLLHKQESLRQKTSSNNEEGNIDASEIITIYKRANHQDVVPIQPDDQMHLTLRPYQAEGLGFMFAKEMGNISKAKSINPLWTEFKSNNDIYFYFCNYSGELLLEFPQETHCCGGILADEVLSDLVIRWVSGKLLKS